ncbi:TPA: hypothetical protein ACM99T_000656 [Escherichia coli]
MKYFTVADVVMALVEGRVTRNRILQNRNAARRSGYHDREALFTEALKHYDQIQQKIKEASKQ